MGNAVMTFGYDDLETIEMALGVYQRCLENYVDEITTVEGWKEQHNTVIRLLHDIGEKLGRSDDYDY